jgi:hypothetical protein
MLENLTPEELSVIHAALIYFVDTEDYTDRESVMITELIAKCEQQKIGGYKGVLPFWLKF